MSSTVPRVLASVLNFNSDGCALRTLACLVGQDYPALDLIVFDNASTDGSREAIHASYPDIPLINTGANLGYCGGNNAALEYGLQHGYDAVVIANHDVEIGPDAVARMVRVAMEQPAVGIVGAQEVDGPSGECRVLGGRQYDFWRSRRQWITDPQALTGTGTTFEMDYVQGAFVLLTRNALERGIRLNEKMFAYADEIELGFQLSRAGLRAYVDPSVLVHHHSRGVPFGPVEGYLTQRNRWYLVRHYGRVSHRVANFTFTLFLELPLKVVVRTLQGHGRYARACVLGFFDGVRGITGIGRVARL
jgi:GT2 family glycosyltransferase